ncbi:autotransporter outer membrane beta-barrel domain-containing protein [Campylobacter volucris]|uniref:Autotransporter outer membrane beta-barrel domain-containing protein n=1 Tax=Campylobacter volucris TaxID=1031542 RepID=A0A5C7DWG4_9BACT|nr:autotransporter outer membrane beta-barrel domain-containing protein [Campylobacter volucris]TXE89472.1 autotransporter outer membrane beta-barrel domain-containing protein [Campylobacter volucris]
MIDGNDLNVKVENSDNLWFIEVKDKIGQVDIKDSSLKHMEFSAGGANNSSININNSRLTGWLSLTGNNSIENIKIFNGAYVDKIQINSYITGGIEVDGANSFVRQITWLGGNGTLVKDIIAKNNALIGYIDPIETKKVAAEDGGHIYLIYNHYFLKSNTNIYAKDNGVIHYIVNNSMNLANIYAQNGTIKNFYNLNSETKKIEAKENGVIENIVNKATIKNIGANQGKIGNISNHSNINTISISNGSSINNILNTNNAKDSSTTQASIAKIEIKDKKSVIKNIINDAKIGEIDNSGSIKNLENYGEINSLSNKNGSYLYIQNFGKINAIDNQGHTTIKHDLSSVISKNRSNHTPLSIKNEGSGGVLIDGYYFNKPEFSKEEQKRNSIQLSGNNINGINIKNIVLNDKDVVKDKIYDSSTFFEYTQKNQNTINNGEGVDANEIISLTGIYDYESVGVDKYKVKEINKNELSGESLIKSLANSSRLRYINISNILDEVTSKNFKTNNHNLDILNSMEDIFIQGNYQTDDHSFFLPYYTKSNINLYNSLKLSSKTNGFIAGSQRKLLKDNGIVSFYLGYEDSKQERNDRKLNLKNDTYHGGVSYYKTLKKDDTYHYYLKTDVNFDYTHSNIEKSYTTTIETTNAKAKTFGYGADILFGGNYYMPKYNLKLNPEFGLSYKGISFNDFNLLHVGGLNEHYLSQQTNFIDSVVALKFQMPLSEKIKTNLKFGTLYNIYNDAKEKLQLGNNQLITNDISFSKWYIFTQAGLSYAINNNMDISLNYNGIFTFEETQAHTAFLKMSLWW